MHGQKTSKCKQECYYDMFRLVKTAILGEYNFTKKCELLKHRVVVSR